MIRSVKVMLQGPTISADLCRNICRKSAILSFILLKPYQNLAACLKERYYFLSNGKYCTQKDVAIQIGVANNILDNYYTVCYISG